MKRRASTVLFLAMASPALHAWAQKPPAPAARAAAPSSNRATLPTLPSVPRVRIQVARDHVVIVQEVNLPRGDWQSGDLDFYVAFGAPGAPQAFDARLLAVADGALEPEATDAGEPVVVERAAHRPPSAQTLIGPSQMAGAVVHVREAPFRRAVAAGNMAALRLRTLLALPEEDARTGREVVVRLGASRGAPLTLGRLQVDAQDAHPHVTRAEAHLCGAEADPYPLAIAVSPRSVAGPASTPIPPAQAPIAPVLSVRHASDDLCVRFWME